MVEDGLVSTPGCTAAIDVGGASHEGPVSTNTVVRNNLTSQLNVDTRDSGVEADHNVVMCCGGREISWYVNGATQYLGNPGTYANANIIDSGGAKSEFVNFNPATLTYNVMLKSGAQAIGAGAWRARQPWTSSETSGPRPTLRGPIPTRSERKIIARLGDPARQPGL